MSKRKLLLADDSITIQKVVNLTFADEGIEVLTVGDGDSAMKKFIEAAPDLVMADVNMPGLDGYQICEMIKQDADTKHIPVILLVGSFEPFNEAEARRVGADDFLTKPFQSIRQLVNKVSDLLVGRETADSPVETSAVNNLDETLDVNSTAEESNSAAVLTDELGDAGMDDEMIQTNQIGSLPVNEAQNFEFAPNRQTFVKDVDFNAFKESDKIESSAEFQVEKVSAQTQPLSFEDSTEIISDENDADAAPLDREMVQSADRQSFADARQNYSSMNEQNETFLRSPIDFDDFDLLEVTPPKKGFSQIDAPDKSRNFAVEQTGTADASVRFENLSPAAIEAIADKVVEKFSDEIIERIIREVTSQMMKRK